MSAEPWRLSLRIDEEIPLDPSLRSQIESQAREALSSGDQANLTAVARAVQSLSPVATVSILRLSDRLVVLHLKKRQPFLCVDADKLRLATAEGEVYGLADDPRSCPGPILTGVFATPQRLIFKPDGTLQISATEQADIRNAIALTAETRAAGLAIQRITSQKFRGLDFSLVASSGSPGTEQKSEEISVTIGQPPYHPKIEKLKNLLAKIRERGDRAERIELDYHGKAFIKTKNM